MTASQEPIVVHIDYTPRMQQQEIADLIAAHRFSVFVAHRRMGKTVALVIELIKHSLSCKLKNPRCTYVGPYLKQAKKVAWNYLKQYTYGIPGIKINESELSIRMPNGAVVEICGADNPDTFRGLYHDLVVLDEPADMKPDVWTEAVRPTLSDRNGKACFIGTPKGLGPFFQIYQRGFKLPDWCSKMYRASETGVLPQEELDSALREIGEIKYAQEYECDFGASQEDVFIPLKMAIPATKRMVAPEVYDHMPIVMGVDPARFGDDAAVVVVRQGPKIHAIHRHHQMNLVDFSHRVAKYYNECVHKYGKKPSMVFVDAVGIGAGVADILRNMNYPVFDVQAGEKAIDFKKYKNRRAEMWGLMKEWLPYADLPDDQRTLAQITSVCYKFAENDRIVLEKKSELKKRGFDSPDDADAISMTFSVRVRPDHELRGSSHVEYMHGRKYNDLGCLV